MVSCPSPIPVLRAQTVPLPKYRDHNKRFHLPTDISSRHMLSDINPIMAIVSQYMSIKPLCYILNLYSDVGQLFLNKTGMKKEKVFKKLSTPTDNSRHSIKPPLFSPPCDKTLVLGSILLLLGPECWHDAQLNCLGPRSHQGPLPKRIVWNRIQLPTWLWISQKLRNSGSKSLTTDKTFSSWPTP